MVGSVALLCVAVASCGGTGSSGGSFASCRDVPRGDNISISWVTFERWIGPAGAEPVLVAFADAVIDRGADTSSRRRVELQSPEVLHGEVPKEFFVGKDSVSQAKSTMVSGERLLLWGWPGFPQPKVFGNVAVVSGDGTVRFLGNCIPRFDSAFAVFAASGESTERAVDVLVRIVTDPNGETATRFKATVGLTLAGP